MTNESNANSSAESNNLEKDGSQEAVGKCGTTAAPIEKGATVWNQTAICVFFGMVGFIYSVFLITVRYPLGRNIYGDIVVENKQEIIEDMLTLRIDCLQRKHHTVRKIYEHGTNVKAEATIKQTLLNKFNGELDKQLLIILRKSNTELENLRFRNSASNMSYLATYIIPEEKSFLNLIEEQDWNGPQTSHLLVAGRLDTCRQIPYSSRLTTVSLDLVRDKRKGTMSFFTYYPIFGFWAVLTIAQMMMWFIIVPLIRGNLKSLNYNLSDEFILTKKSRLVNLLLPLLFVVSFCGIFYWVLADKMVVTDSHFLSNYNTRMLFYSIPGYGVAIYCLSGYLSVSQKYDIMNSQVESRPELIADGSFKSRFFVLRSTFDNTFIFTAIILSVMIFWIGIIVHALNQTEVFKFFNALYRHEAIPGDFVYMMGLLHTCVLLTFYIPVKLKISSSEISKNDEIGTPGQPAKVFFDKVLSQLGTVLATVSPIVASFIQDLINFLFQQ